MEGWGMVGDVRVLARVGCMRQSNRDAMQQTEKREGETDAQAKN